MQYPPSKTEPWNHQIIAWNYIKENPAFYLAHEMGVGKTKVAIDASTGFDAKNILIICPKKVIDVWPAQFEIHSSRKVDVHVFKKGTAISKALEIERRLRLSNGKPQAFVLNYDICIRPPLGPTVKKGHITKPGTLLKHRWDMLIADEAHRIKKPGGKQSWQLYRLGKINRRKLFLSGTPMPHSPLDIYAQYRALNPKIFACNYTTFRARYAVMGGYLGKQIFGFQNIEDLNKRFFSIAHEVLADNVLDLPPKVDREIYFDLLPATMKIYKAIEKDFIAAWDAGEITADNVLVKLLRLSQLACGIAKIDDNDREVIIDTGKVDRIMSFLQDIPPSQPIAIYYKFTPEGRLLKQELLKTGRTVSMVSGQHDQLKEWQDGKTDTIVLQIDAGSEGIDLTRAQYCIYSSTGLKLGTYRQSRRRIRRPGQTQKVFYYHVLGNQTIDIANLAALKDKREVVDFFLRGLHDFMAGGAAPKTKKIRGMALAQLMGNI